MKDYSKLRQALAKPQTQSWQLAGFGPTILAALDELEAERIRAEKAEAALLAVQALIDDSYGVTGLHLNGDVAPWDSLLEGGYFEDWLRDFSIAMRELEARDE